MPKVESFPLQVAIDSEFTSNQRQLISQAIAEWNAVSQSLIHQDIFQAEFAALPSSIRQLNPQDCDQQTGSSKNFTIVRDQSRSHWQQIGFSSSVPAATVRCASGGKVSKQIVMVNTTTISDSSLLHVVTHELGHAIGLNHSCTEGAGSGDYRSCDGLSASHPYRAALMYPWISSSNASVSRISESVIKTNDRARASCVMK